MKFVLKAKWWVMLAWLLVIALLLVFAPNLSTLVQSKGQATVPKGYNSTEASDLLNQWSKQDGTNSSSQVLLVFHDNKGLSTSEVQESKKAFNYLKSHKESLGLTDLTSHFDQPSLKDKMVSKDHKTIIVVLSLSMNKKHSAIVNQLNGALKPYKVDHYYTSSWMIEDDFTQSTQEGLHKSEWITIIFILLVLFIVFRSAVAPLVPLITVGITFMVSQSILAFLVERFNFPLSNFTQIFLVAVLFGIGTDYCILLLSRFKEEINQHETTRDAILTTFRHGGRTVFFSCLAVFIGFSAIGLSTFNIYQSAAGVAVGIAVLFFSLLTVVPFFMAILGRRLFWPTKKSLSHNQSKMWGGMGRFAFKRPLVALLIVAAIILPFLLTYHGDKSFNQLDEMGDKYPSVKGFNYVAQSFGPGESMPTTIVIKNDERMDSKRDLQTIEAISQEVKKVNHVKSVQSVTRPTGSPISNFLVPNQALTLNQGLNKTNDGVKKIANGLSDAATKLSSSQPDLQKSTSGIQGLISGTSSLQNGLVQLQTGLQQVETGMKSGTSGANDLENGLKKAEAGAKQLGQSSDQLYKGYQQIGGGLNQLQSHYVQATQGLNQGLGQLRDGLTAYANEHPEAKNDKYFGPSLNGLNDMLNPSNTNSPLNALVVLNQNLQGATTSLSKANAGLNQLTQGQTGLTSGLGQLVSGIDQLRSGLNQVTNGQGQIIQKMPALTSGTSQVNNGQKQLLSGFSQLNNQMGTLINGLNKSTTGLNKVSNGLTQANDFLSELSNSNSQLSGFYIPDAAIKSTDFQKAMNVYMSKDRKYTKLSVIFDVNPYSVTALNQIQNVKAAVSRVTKGTSLENANVAIGGITSTNADLEQMSHRDYTRTVTLMLIGIGLILMALFRSIIMPLYVLLSLVLSYFTAMGISEAIFVHLLGKTGINWAVPFFGFVMLVALGVDYSIFLMDRFNEHQTLDIAEAMIDSMKNMGSVILSAAVILGGTFAAMYPSGVMTLSEIATIIISGLVLYACVFLPLFIPVMVRTFGKANWWPFKPARSK
jgi:putative drug exporter of the RND superfamily